MRAIVICLRTVPFIMVHGSIDANISELVNLIDGNLDLLGNLFRIMLCNLVLQQLIRRAAFNAFEIIGSLYFSG